MMLKELRTWHWKQALMLRERASRMALNLHSENANVPVITVKLREANEGANFHIKAVQALNDVVPGTAEQDLAERERANTVGKQS